MKRVTITRHQDFEDENMSDEECVKCTIECIEQQEYNDDEIKISVENGNVTIEELWGDHIKIKCKSEAYIGIMRGVTRELMNFRATALEEASIIAPEKTKRLAGAIPASLGHKPSWS